MSTKKVKPIRFDSDLWGRIEAAAEARGMSVSDIVRQCCDTQLSSSDDNLKRISEDISDIRNTLRGVEKTVGILPQIFRRMNEISSLTMETFRVVSRLNIRPLLERIFSDTFYTRQAVFMLALKDVAADADKIKSSFAEAIKGRKIEFFIKGQDVRFNAVREKIEEVEQRQGTGKE